MAEWRPAGCPLPNCHKVPGETGRGPHKRLKWHHRGSTSTCPLQEQNHRWHRLCSGSHGPHPLGEQGLVWLPSLRGLQHSTQLSHRHWFRNSGHLDWAPPPMTGSWIWPPHYSQYRFTRGLCAEPPWLGKPTTVFTSSGSWDMLGCGAHSWPPTVGECPLPLLFGVSQHLHCCIKERSKKGNKAAQSSVGSSLPTTTDIYTTRCKKRASCIMRDPTHPHTHCLSVSPQTGGWEALAAEPPNPETASVRML